MIIQVGNRYAVRIDDATVSGTVQEIAHDTTNGVTGALTIMDDFDTYGRRVIYPTDFVADITGA
jgi:hypothetical protein